MALKTNTEFMVELMEFSAHGALAQCFILEGLAKYADIVIDEWERGKRWPEPQLISQERWVDISREIKEKLEARYGQ